MFWSTKEKFCLLFDILELGDQNESWMQISADLNRKFLSNSPSTSPIKREAKYSIKNCKEEYRNLVDQYKSRWIDEQEKCPKQWKTPLVKFIFQEFKSIYLKELISQIKESRKKILDMCLQLEPTINLKSQRNESFQMFVSPLPFRSSLQHSSSDLQPWKSLLNFLSNLKRTNSLMTKFNSKFRHRASSAIRSIRRKPKKRRIRPAARRPNLPHRFFQSR